MHNKYLKLILILSIICTVVGCDQWSKFFVKNTLEMYTTYHIVGNLIVLCYTENSGGFLGLGSGLHPGLKPAIFLIIPAIVLLALLIYTLVNSIRKKALPTIDLFGFCCIIGGGIGNLIDRSVYGGKVIDFMNFGIGELRTGILNVADLAVTLGITIIISNQIRTIIVKKHISDGPVT